MSQSFLHPKNVIANDIYSFLGRRFQYFCRLEMRAFDRQMSAYVLTFHRNGGDELSCPDMFGFGRYIETDCLS